MKKSVCIEHLSSQLPTPEIQELQEAVKSLTERLQSLELAWDQALQEATTEEDSDQN